MKRSSQRGATLVIALIMLVLLTLFGLSAMNTGITNLKIVGNMQSRNEAMSAAQQAIETVISTPGFITNPANAIVTPCAGANTVCTDLTGDGVAEYVTRLNPAPACIAVRAIKMSELNWSNAEDVGCTQEGKGLNIEGAASGDSMCASAVWEITAETTSTAGSASAAVTQGIGVRITTDDMASSCL
jgi:Tfp pilus assembly protein PilX